MINLLLPLNVVDITVVEKGSIYKWGGILLSLALLWNGMIFR